LDRPGCVLERSHRRHRSRCHLYSLVISSRRRRRRRSRRLPTRPQPKRPRSLRCLLERVAISPVMLWACGEVSRARSLRVLAVSGVVDSLKPKLGNQPPKPRRSCAKMCRIGPLVLFKGIRGARAAQKSRSGLLQRTPTSPNSNLDHPSFKLRRICSQTRRRDTLIGFLGFLGVIRAGIRCNSLHGHGPTPCSLPDTPQGCSCV
jgi:hypothetical protein